MLIKKLKQSLTIKIFFITSILLILACFATYAFISTYMPVSYSIAMDRNLDQNIKELIGELEKVNLKDAGELLNGFKNTWNVDIDLYDPVLNEEVTIPGYRDSSHDNVETVTTVITEDKNDVYLTEGDAIGSSTNYSVTFANSDKVYTLSYISYYVENVNQASLVLRSILPWLIVMVITISLLGSLFYSWYVTRPIVRISNISKKMANMEFDWKCQERRTDEIGVLANSLNEMSASLYQVLTRLQEANASLQDDIEFERKMEQQRLEFFSAVSHELKTPLTVIKGQLEGMLHNVGAYKDRDKFLVRSLKVTDDMDAMIQQIMTISRMEYSQFQLNKISFDFSELVRTQLNKVYDLCLQKNQSVSSNISDNAMIRGDTAMIEKVVSNILSNAIHYSPEHASLHINMVEQENGLCFSLENSGAHIPEEDLPNIFQAFYRVEKSRNRTTGGSGLGLYLVKMILDQHGASYCIENTSAGVRFTTVFPK